MQYSMALYPYEQLWKNGVLPKPQTDLFIWVTASIYCLLKLVASKVPSKTHNDLSIQGYHKNKLYSITDQLLMLMQI